MMKSSLALKLAVVVLVFSTLILGAVVANSYLYSRKLIVQQAEELSRTRGRAVANQLAVTLKPIEQTVRNIGLTMEDASLTSEKIASLTRLVVENNSDIFGMAIAFEPYGFSRDQLFFAPYSFRQKTTVQTTQLGNADYRYFYMDWYQLPRELGHPVWTEPYYDDGGADTFLTTYSAPFYRMEDGKKIFAGVITADITLEWLQKLMSTIKLYDTGFAMLLSREGTFIYHPRPEYLYNETVFSLSEELEDPKLWQIGRNMIDGKTGFMKWENIQKNSTSFLLYMPLPIDGWSLALFFPRREVLESVNDLARNTLLIGLIGFLLFTAVIVLISRRMTRPIHDLSTAALEIAGGNLQAVLPKTYSRDEVGKLTESFSLMQHSLQEYIANLETTTRQKERIESELRIAHDIQMGILPKIFPPFPEHDEFEIYASVEPAREVGGDLYDFFFIDKHLFCFLIGDVSGKGVPAAFLMAVTKTLLKVVAETGVKPGEIMEKVNNDLAEDNESCMFVTIFLAILDIRTGVVSYSSAGHNPPIVKTVHGVSFVAPLNEPIAGAMPDMQYSTCSLTLDYGDIMYLYTDGVTEAMNEKKEIYSDARLLSFLGTVDAGEPATLIQAVNRSITGFAGDAEQSDDITMLALKYKGEKSENNGE